MTASLDTIAARLADIIDTHGWARGTLKTADGRVCLVGAIDELPEADRPAARLATAIACKGSQIAWNDAKGRTEG
ncbi:MAG TPA: hypothetical protein VFH45_08975, partial [Acidimicrobiales bacterium]|nr:hypothetical protein [Acidimicrobiales bacterium]